MKQYIICGHVSQQVAGQLGSSQYLKRSVKWEHLGAQEYVLGVFSCLVFWWLSPVRVA